MEMFKVLSDVCTPTRGSEFSAGVDLSARVPTTIKSGETKLIPLGIEIDLTEVKKSCINGTTEKELAEKYYPTKFNKWVEALWCKGELFEFEVEIYNSRAFDNRPQLDGSPIEVGLRFFKAYYNGDKFRKFISEYYLQVMLRSSLATKKGLIIPNGAGVIDIDYNKEIQIIVHNPNATNVHIVEGDRIAQIILLKHSTDLLGVHTKNIRDGGFGSTDK